MILKHLLMFSNGTTDSAWVVKVLICVDLEFSNIPNLINFSQVLLNLELFLGRVSNILNIFLYTEQISGEQVIESESLGIIRNFLASDLLELVPMTWLD